MANYTEEEILKDLDTNGLYEFFFDLEHGYFYTSGSRINLFADENRWAIVFEKSGFGNRSGDIEIVLDFCGNCILNKGSNDSSNNRWVQLTSYDQLTEIQDGFELVSKRATTVPIRDQSLQIEQDPTKYAAKGINILEYDNPNNLIDFVSMTRYLNESHPSLFHATETELRQMLPGDLPLIMQLNEWHHETIQDYDGPHPSECETFQLIAKVLVSNDVSKWKPTKAPTNNWRNWPEAGTL